MDEERERLEELIGRPLPAEIVAAQENYPVEFRGAAFERDFDPTVRALLVSNLTVRHESASGAFGGKDWPSTFLAIGDDSCGNTYAVDASKPGASVLFYDHEQGEFEEWCPSVEAFVMRLKDQLQEVNERTAGDVPSGRMTIPQYFSIRRSEVAVESVLDPISTEEWRAAVATIPELTLVSTLTQINPFTKEEFQVKVAEFAKVSGGEPGDRFTLSFGRVDALVTSRTEPLAGPLAAALSAKLVRFPPD